MLPALVEALPSIVTDALFGLPRDTPEGLESFTENDLVPENEAAALIGTEIVFEFDAPAAHVSVPDVDVKFVPAIAVPPDVAYCTLTPPLLAPESVTVNVTEFWVCETV